MSNYGVKEVGVIKKLRKGEKRKIVRHIAQRSEERYGGIHTWELERIARFHKLGEVVRLGQNEYINWLSDGRMIRYIYTRASGISTVLPIRGNELAKFRY